MWGESVRDTLLCYYDQVPKDMSRSLYKLLNSKNVDEINYAIDILKSFKK